MDKNIESPSTKITNDSLIDEQLETSPSNPNSRCSNSYKLFKCNTNQNLYHNGEDWHCTCKNGTRQSPIDLPDFRELFSFQKDKTKEMVVTIPEVKQCLLSQCSDDYSAVVAMINSVSTWNIDQTTQNQSGSYVPITGNLFYVRKDEGFQGGGKGSKFHNRTELNMINYGSGLY